MRKRAWGLLPPVVTLGLVTALVCIVDWPQVVSALRTVNPLYAAGVIMLVCVERLVLNVKWHMLLAEGRVVVGYLRLLRIQLAANALGTLLPSSLGVDALRVAGLWRVESHRSAVLAATLLDRLTTVIATVVVGGTMIVLVAGRLVGNSGVQQALVSGMTLGVAFAAMLSPAGRRALARMSTHLPAVVRRRLADAFAAAWTIGTSRRAVVVTVLTSLGAIALRIVIGKMLLLAAGTDVPLATLCFVLPVVWGVTMLPISISGIGVQDTAYVVLLGQAGVAAPVAVAVSLLDHILTRVPIVFGLLFWRDVVPVGGLRASGNKSTTQNPTGLV